MTFGRRCRFFRRRLRRDRRAMAAVEMAMLSPVYLLLLGGAVDYGGALYVKFNLTASVSAAANFALLNSGQASSSGGAALAGNLAAIAASSHAANWANVSVSVNNGPSVTISGGVSTTGGTASNANSCYCPTGSKTNIVWGAATACGAACGSGGYAGKFVSISASRAFTPMILPASLIASSFTVSSMAQVQ